MLKTVRKTANWQPYWRSAARAVKRAVYGRHTVRIAGSAFRVAYETRSADQNDDLVLLAELAQGRKCILDVGANVGLTTLVMSTALANDGVVFAFDASEACCLVIRENAILNALESKIKVINSLVADKSGTVQSFNWNFVSGNASTVRSSLNGQQLPFFKSVISLDDFAKSMAVSPDLVKIDVEGAELQVLRGMRDTLVNCRPLVWVEFHAWPEKSLADGMAEALLLLAPLGYEVLEPVSKRCITRAAEFAPGNLAPYGRAYALLKPQDAASR